MVTCHNGYRLLTGMTLNPESTLTRQRSQGTDFLQVSPHNTLKARCDYQRPTEELRELSWGKCQIA